MTPENNYYFYHYDGLGSTIAITDSAGQVVNSYAYSPEGLVGGQETISNAFKYVGRYGVMDEGNGLLFMRARYYDPEVGRFINKDPIGYAGGMNLYVYVANNPINWVDTEGLIVHQGFVKMIIKISDKSLRRTMKSLRKQIMKHEKALIDPSQSLAKKHHAQELKTFREQLKLAQEEAKRRGLPVAGAAAGAGFLVEDARSEECKKFAEDISEEEAERRTSSFFDWLDPFLAPGNAY